MIRFRKLISTSAVLKLYKAFILPHFLYCSTVWHFCSSRNRGKLEALNRRALRIVFHDNDSTYQQLLNKAETTSLYNQRIQSTFRLTTIYKFLHFANYPKHLKKLLTLRPSIYNLKGTDILSLPKPATTTYGLHSFKYYAVKLWN